MMKSRFALAALLAVTAVSLRVSPQEKPKPSNKPPTTTLKVQVIISENEGEKKLANLPYTFFLVASDATSSSPWTKVRMGSRVPVATGSYQLGASSGSADGNGAINGLVNTQFQYIDVGTHIDARAMNSEDGRFELALNLERSWIEGDIPLPGDKRAATSGESNSGQFREPIIRQFKTELILPMRDGQTIQSTQATDPLSGRVLTITVTVNAVK